MAVIDVSNATNRDETVENLNRPAMPEGTFLAVVTGAVIHQKNDNAHSLSIKWDMSVNISQNTEAWDAEGRVLDLRPANYTPLGTVDGVDAETLTEALKGSGELPSGAVLTLSRGYGITDRMKRALGQTGDTIDLKDAVGRIVRVVIKHERDNRQTAEMAELEGTRWSAKVNGVAPFVDADGIRAPRLISNTDESPATEPQF